MTKKTKLEEISADIKKLGEIKEERKRTNQRTYSE
jgi:hypothetical protein